MKIYLTLEMNFSFYQNEKQEITVKLNNLEAYIISAVIKHDYTKFLIIFFTSTKPVPVLCPVLFKSDYPYTVITPDIV